MFNLGIFRGSFGLFNTLTGFSRHFMCIIQIWTTSTCSNGPKLVENHMCVLGWISRSHARDGNEFQTPWHCWLPTKRWDTWFLNSSKSKTRQKFMKLGMLSWTNINMAWYKFCPTWGRFGYMLLSNQRFSQQAWWFRWGTSYLWGWNDIRCLLLLSKHF